MFYGGLGSNDLFSEFAQATKNPAAGANWVLEGDVDKALAGAEKVLEMEYTTDMVCHATMEPLNATVQFVDGASNAECRRQRSPQTDRRCPEY